MKGFHPISKKKKWLIGALTPVMAVCLAMGLVFMNATEGFESPVYAATGFNNIVNANIGMHPKWIEDTCITAKAGGVGDTYTSKHKVWHADVTTKAQDGVGNDVVMEKSPSYVFQGNEEHAAELIKTYSLKRGNEVVFNITDGDSAAKVWADAVAFAQTLGEATPLADKSLAGETSNAACGGNGENHDGFRVGTNTGTRNMYKGNFFIKNTDEDGNQVSLGQYIIVRLQADWTAKSITTTAPTAVEGQTVTNKQSSGSSDYLTKVTGSSSAVTTTSFNYVTNTGNNTPNVFGKGTYLPTQTSADGFTRIDSNDSNYVISWDLASNSCDYDGAQSGQYGYVYNDNCAFSYGRINVPTGVYIVLDLNGHKIDRALTSTTANYYGSVFHIDSKARLEIMDSTAYENASAARIEGTSAAGYNADSVHTTNHKGTITGGQVKSTVTKNDNSATLQLPQTLRATLQSNGGGFNLSMWADVVVHSGTISNNVNASGTGGAFYQRSKAAVTVFDGYVLDNQANSGGVTNLGSGSGCPFTMYGGVLAYNKAASGDGGAVNLAESSYGNFHGGEIMYNEATGQTTVDDKTVHVTYDGKKPTFFGCGGAICLAGNTLGILENVTIANNKASSSGTESASNHQYSLGGGGVFVNPAVGAVDEKWKTKDGVTDHAFKFRGSLQIYGNTAGSTTDNVHLGYGFVGSGFLPGLIGETLGSDYTGYPKIGIGGPLIANGIVANVGVTLGNYSFNSGIFTSGYGKNGNQTVDTFLYFSSDNSQYSVVNQGEGEDREATLGTKVQGNSGITWVIEGTGTDADTDLSDPNKGEATLKIVIGSSGTPTFYYKNPNNNHGLNSELTKVDGSSKMNQNVPLTKGDPTDELLKILQDRFTYSSGSLEFEYSMLKVTKISAYTGSPNFGDTTFTVPGGVLPIETWESTQTSPGDESTKPTYTITNTFDNANFHFKLGEKDLTATKGQPSDDMKTAISATDGSISYAGEYSVLVSGARYTNPSFKIKINQVGVEVGRTLYYNGQNIATELQWLKDIDWDGSGKIAESGEDAKLGDEHDQPYFIYSGGYYYPILNADYDRLQVFSLYDPYTKTHTSVAKASFTGYVLEFTYANQYFGTNQPVQFGSHSGGGIEYQTMHRQPGATSAGIGTYVPGVRNAGMYTVQFISSRSAESAEAGNADYEATGVYFAANNFAFSSGINIYVEPASAEVELTKQAQDGFTYNAREIGDESIVIYDNTSNTHVNPHLDDAAKLEYFLFDDLKLKAGVYDKRTKLYYTLDQIADWKNVRPYGQKEKDGEEDKEWAAEGKAKGGYFPSYKDEELESAPVVLWDSQKDDKFDPATANIPDGLLNDTKGALEAFQALYKKDVDPTSTGKLVYIVDPSSFESGGATKLDSNPTDARRYIVFVTLDLDAGYEDYNYVFDQDAEHLVGLGGVTPYFWAFEFTVNPAEINPFEGSSAVGDNNTAVTLTKDVWYNGDSYGYKYYSTVDNGETTWQFKQDELSEQANLPTVIYYGAGAGSELVLGDDYEIAFSSFNGTNPDGTSSFNYLDASVGLGNGPAFDGFHFGAYNLAVKITFGGKNKNYVNKKYEAGTPNGEGTAYEDSDGAFYIYFRICPVVVSASGSLSYTYDGGSFDRARYLPPNDTYGAWYESIFFLVQDGITTPNELIEHQHESEYTTEGDVPGRTLEELWGGVEVRGGVPYGDTSFYKGRYTLGSVSVAYSNEEFKSHDIAFGLGLYSFRTGSPNYQATPYHLTTAAYDNNGQTGTNSDGVGVAPNAGVTWLLTTTVNGVQTQTFNTSSNFIINETDSWLDVSILQKDISNDYGSIVKFGEKAYDHVSSGGSPLTSSATGASYPFAGNNWSYIPAVTFDYVPSFSVALAGDRTETRYYEFGKVYQHGLSKYEGETLKVALSGDEADGFSGITLLYTGNEAVSGENGAIVRVTGMGNYTGTFRLTFTIDPAEIEATIDDSSKTGEVRYDMQPHAPKINYENKKDYTSYLSGSDGLTGEGSGITYNGHLLQYTGAGSPTHTAPVPGGSGYQAPTIEYRSLRSEYRGATDEWTTSQPVYAKKYKIKVSTTSSDFVFVEDDPDVARDFKHEAPEGETKDVRTVYGAYTILPAIVSVKASNSTSTVTYNGDPQSPVLEFSNTSLSYVIPHDDDYSITNYSLTGGTYTYNEATAPKDAGVYTVTIALTKTALGQGSYCNFAFQSGSSTATTATITFTIEAAEIDVSVAEKSTYNGNGQQPDVTFTNSERGNDAVPKEGEYSITYSGDKLGDDAYPKNAGAYTVTVTLTGNGLRNFKLKQDDDRHPFTIVPATVTAFLTEGENSKDPMNTSINFDNEEHKAGVGFTSNTAAVPGADAYELTYKYNGWKTGWNVNNEDAFTNAGYYTVSIALTEHGNFCFSGTAEDSYVYTRDLSYNINHHFLMKDDLVFKAKSDDSPIYGLQKQNNSVIVGLDGEKETDIVYTGDQIKPIEGLTITGSDKNTHTLTPNEDYVIAYIDNTNAGKCSVTVTGMHNFVGTLELSFTINPKSLGSSTEQDYNTKKNGNDIYCKPVTYYVFNGNAQTIVVNMTYEAGTKTNTLVEGSDYTFLKAYLNGEEKKEVSFTDEIKEAGIYTILIKGKENGNYTGIYVLEVEVLPAGITARAATESFTYDGNSHLSGVIFVAGADTPVPKTVNWDDESRHFNPQGNNWVWSNDEFTLTISYIDGYTPFAEGAFENGNEFRNAGTYTVKVEFAEGKNFKFAKPTDPLNDRVMTYTYTINPAVIAITEFKNKTYNGQEQGVDITDDTFASVSGGLNGADILSHLRSTNGFTDDQITYDLENGAKPKDAQRYNVTVTLKNGGNFAFGRGTSTRYTYTTTSAFTIDPFDIRKIEESDITIAGCTYTGVTLTPDVTVTCTLIKGKASYTLVKEKDFNVSYMNNVNASDKAEAVLVGVGNFTGTKMVNFTIEKKSIGDGTTNDGEITAEGAENAEYNGLPYNPNLTIKYSPKDVNGQINALILGEAGSSADYHISYLNEDGTSFEGVPQNAGIYLILVTANDGNYTGSFKIKFVITPTTLTLELNGAKEYIYTGTAVRPDVFLLSTNGVSPESGKDYEVGATTYQNDNKVAGADHGNYTNAGTYTITVTIKSGNYVFKDETGDVKTASVSYRILPARLEVSLSDASAAYNGEGHNLKDKIVFTNLDGTILPGASEYTIAYDIKDGSKGELDGSFPLTLGNYTVTVTLNKNGNFIFDAAGYNTSDPDTYVPSAYVLSKDLDYVIGQMNTTVTLDTLSLIYNAKDQKQSPVFGTTVITSDDYTVEYKYSPLSQSAFVLATDFANAGRYEVTVTLKARDGYDQPFFKLVNSTAGTVTDGTSWTAEYTIAQASVHVEQIKNSGTYNGKEFNLRSDEYFSFNNLDGNESVVPEASDDDYNGYTVNYSGTEKPHHTDTYSGMLILGHNFKVDNANFTFTVTPQIVGVGLYKAGDEVKAQDAWEEYTSMAYDGAVHNMFDLISILFTDTVNSELYGLYKNHTADDAISSYSVQYNGSIFDEANIKFSAAGIYTITVVLTPGGDYSFGYNGNYIYQSILSFTIEQLDIGSAEVRLKLVVTGGPYYYTGSAITLGEKDVEVYLIHRHQEGNDWVDYDERAPEGLKPVQLTPTQYILMYANNINAGTANVTVIGQGAITGQDHATFEILPKPLGKRGTGNSWTMENEFSIENLGTFLAGVNVFYYNGSQVSLTPSVVYTPASLSGFTIQTSDYTLSWKTKNGSAWTPVTSSTPTDAGEYILRVTAKSGGNYADQFDVNFRILPAQIKAELGTSDNYYTGEGQNAAINFYYLSDDVTLNGLAIPSNAVAHTVSYTGVARGLPINAGSYGVTVTLTEACKNFVFSYGANGLPDEARGRTYTLTSQFEIKRALVLAELNTPSATYTGKAFDCKPYIAITPLRGGSESDAWKSAIADFTLAYLDKDGGVSAPLTVGEYKITVELNNPNLEFFTPADSRDGRVSTPFTFNVSRASLRAKEGGEFDDGHTNEPINGKDFNLKVPGRMDGGHIIYDPAHAVVFGITATEDFELFREEDVVSIKYTVRTAAAASAFAYTGSGVNFTGSGTFDVEVEVTSANYETAKFTVHVVIDTKDIIITTDGTISTTYGDSDSVSSEALLNAFLAIVTEIQGVPGGVTGLEEQKDWLKTWGLGVSVVFGDDDISTAGKLKVGSYSLKLTLGLADKNVCFSAATSGDASVSRDGLYEVAKKDIALDWDLGDIEYDATSHYGALLYKEENGSKLSGVFHTAVLGGDEVSFARYTISQYNNATREWNAIVGATDFALRNVGRYKITVGGTLNGADSANYSFSGADREFEITRMVVSVNVADARIVYGEDFKTVLSLAFDNVAKFEEILSREADSDFGRAVIESFLKSLLVLQAQAGGAVYDGLGDLPPIGRYYIKFGAGSGVDADGRILNDDDIYSNYSFVIYGQYGGAPYATLTVFSTNVTVILNDRDVALEIGYGEYKYSAGLTGNYGEDEKFALTARLSEYIFENILGAFGSERRVRSIVGLDEVYPGATWEELANLITMNCWFEVVDPKISTGGYLMPGTYDLKILTKEECGFNVSFLPNYSGTLIGQSGANRLVISPKTLDIDWATAGADVSVDGNGNVLAAYTSFAYGNRPLFTNISEGDDVGDPIFHVSDLGGATLAEGPVNVGNYYIYVDGIAVGADNGCYVLPADLRTGLEIVPRRLTVNVHNSTSIYGEELACLAYDVPWDWENRNDTVDDLHITLKKADGKNAGSYSILGSYNNANYDLSFTEATYEITQREIEVRMDDLTSYYGERYKDFTFTQTGGSFAPGETLADLKIVGTKAGGADAGEYAIYGEDVDPNYHITVLPGTYTILQAINEWYGDFSFGGWGAGDPPKDPDLPGAKFGDIEVRYYYDEACTQEIEDLAALPEGEYFIKLTVDETRNYTGLSATYNFPVEHVIDATLYVILFVSQFVILTGALIFIRRKKSDEDKNNKQ